METRKKKKPKIDVKFVITEAIVVEYARVSREAIDVTAQRDALNANIKAALKRGQECPRTTPYLLVVMPQLRCTRSWKDIAEMLISALPARAKAHAIALVARLQAEKVECPTLEVVPNRLYRFTRSIKNGRWVKK